MSDMFIWTFGSVRIVANIITPIINKMFMIIANVEYAPRILLLNLAGPINPNHTANSNVMPPVNINDCGPNIKPVNSVNTANAMTVIVPRDAIQFVKWSYHAVRIGNAGRRVGGSGKIYPGIHNRPNPIGMVQIMRHVDTPIARARQNLAYTFDMNNPNKYI